MACEVAGAEFDVAPSPDGIAASASGNLPARGNLANGVLDERDDAWVLALSRNADAVGDVFRAEIVDIDPIHLEQRVEVLDRALALDVGDHHGLAVGGRRVLSERLFQPV